MSNKFPQTKLLIQSPWLSLLIVSLFVGCGGRIAYAQNTPVITFAVTTDPTPGAACNAYGVLELNTKNGNSWVCPTNTSIWTLFNAGGGGGSTAWGAIIGTLSNQTDLQAALNGKQPTGNYLVDPASNGLVFRSSLNTTRVAVAADVSTLFTGSGPCFLNKDGTCSNPTGTGNVSNSGTPTVSQVAVWVDATHIQGVPALTKAQQFATTVYTDAGATFGAFTYDFGLSSLLVPNNPTLTVDRTLGYDATNHLLLFGRNGGQGVVGYFIGGPPTVGNCVTVGSTALYQLSSTPCPGGVGTTGSPTSGQYAKFSAASTITGQTGIPGADLTGSRTVPQTTLPLGTTSLPGVLQPDGTTITVNGSGIISSIGGSVPTGGTLPGTCAAGTLFTLTSALPGQQLYECSSTNTYIQQGGLDGTNTLRYTAGGGLGISPTIVATFAGANTGSQAWTGFNDFNAAPGIQLPEVNFASLPAASAQSGREYVIKNSSSSATCAATSWVCRSNGTSWIDIGGSGGGGPVTQLVDTNGNPTIASAAAVTSAVNSLYVANAATGNSPTIGTGGSDADIDLNINAKGNGGLNFQHNGGTWWKFRIDLGTGARLFESAGAVWSLDADGNIRNFASAHFTPVHVAALGTCAVDTLKAVDDALTPTWGTALTGGGAVHTMAYCNGTAWTAH